jgi:hypothetical protein
MPKIEVIGRVDGVQLEVERVNFGEMTAADALSAVEAAGYTGGALSVDDSPSYIWPAPENTAPFTTSSIFEFDDAPALDGRMAVVEGMTATRTYAGIRQVEIFRTGTHNGDKYTQADLDAMVKAFGKVGFNVPIKLGHFEPSGERAFGWVENLKRKGTKLVADFMDMPQNLVDLVQERAFEHVSAEVFFDLERNGKIFRRVLKAVALLGAETPAVSGLKPLHTASVFADDEAAVRTYQFSIEDEPMPEKTPKTSTEAEQIAALKAERDELKTAVTEVSAKVAELTETKEAETASALEVKRLQEQVAALTEANKEAAEARRIAEIEGKMANFTWPALADHFRALYDAASSNPNQKVAFFAEGTDGKRVASEESLIKVVDDLRARLEKSTRILMEHKTVPGPVGDLRPADAPTTAHASGDEINRLVGAYRAANKDASYSDALDAVMADPNNADIARSYVKGQ